MTKYKFERMDFESAMMIINVVVIIAWNKGAYVGLPVAIIGLVWDLIDKVHVNGILMHLALIIMNHHFLMI